VGCSLGALGTLVGSFFWGFVLAFGVLVGFSWVSFGSPMYTSSVLRGALRFFFSNKFNLSKKIKKLAGSTSF